MSHGKPAGRGHVARYYDEKTARLLEKYGPGPRVHFHVGFLDEDPPAEASAAELRRGLVLGQERLLRESLAAWGEPSFAGHVVDVGCGLGGTALLLLEETPCARVTGVTVAAKHAAVVRAFAEDAGVAERVVVEVCDASAIAGEARFDTAISVEASCYFDRRAWLACMRRVLKPGGRVYLLDGFEGSAEAARLYDDYWLTRVGTLAEYQSAAAEHGFVIDDVVELNERCLRFWDWSLAYTDRRLGEALDDDERARLGRSRAAHVRFRETFASGGLRYLRAVLRRHGD